MKRLLICLLGVVMLLAMPAIVPAGEKELAFGWGQSAIDLTPSFIGWKMWISETSGGPYTQFGADIVYDGTPAPEYHMTEVLISPDGQKKTYYFVVNAWNDKGASGDSNEVSAEIDFTTVPNVPVTLTVTVTDVPVTP